MKINNIKSIISVITGVFIFEFTICYFSLGISGTKRNFIIQNEISVSQANLTVDGSLNDEIWKYTPVFSLEPAEKGVPEELGGNIRIVLRGNHLCIGAFCPEPGGKVLAKSIGYNPIWEKDAYTSPYLEDRLLCQIRFNSIGNKESELSVEINPWGAFRVERDGALVPRTKTLTAADITKRGWIAETAIPLDEINLNKNSNNIEITIEQIRSRRALAPEFRWKLQDKSEFVEFIFPERNRFQKKLADPVFAPPLLGNTESPLQVGYVQVVPPIDTGWEDPFWKNVPGFQLPRNEFSPRNPHYPTEIKWVHDGKTLAVFFRCTDDLRLDCDTGARDGNVDGDDHVGLYFSTTGSSIIEVLANPAGAVKDLKGTGPHFSRVGRISGSSWNGNIQRHCLVVNDAWYVRLNLPLDEIAIGLGELDIPRNWRILISRVRQARAGEPREISSIPIIGNPFLFASARFRSLTLTNIEPSKVIMPEPVHKRPHLNGLAGELMELNSNALSRPQRHHYKVQSMLDNNIRERMMTLALEEQKEFDSIKTIEDWEEYRDKRIKVIKSALGEFPETRPPLLYQVSGTHKADGYQVKNIVYQSRPGVFVAANLYLPAVPTQNMPGIIINPGFHYPKTQGELKDCGMIWARAGCAVLVLDRLGQGECTETNPWYRYTFQSEPLIDMQLELVGQSRYGWYIWDIMRSVDIFEELGNIDRDRMILMGSVTWTGYAPAAIAGMLEKRLDCMVIFGCSRVNHFSCYELRGTVLNKITPWFLGNASAPRKWVVANEFWFEGPNWIPGWPRYEKIYKLYGSEENLAKVQGKGLIRIQATKGDCWNIGTDQRRQIYPVLKKWFDIPLPSKEDQNIDVDTELSFYKDSPDYPVMKFKESERRLPDSALLSITPEISAKLNRKPMHRIAKEIGENLLKSSREKMAQLDGSSKRQFLIEHLSKILGDVEPVKDPEMKPLWTETLSGASAEAFTLKSEKDIIIPVIIIKPDKQFNKPVSLVIALAEGGKDRFLKDKSKEIEKLIQNGIAVCIPDVRGTGETAPDQYNRNNSLVVQEFELGNTLVGLRLKDIRTVLIYIKTRRDFDSKQIALWGDSFAQANQGDIWVDELQRRPGSPQIQHFSSPLGAHLALLTALFHNEICAVATSGGLVGYLSVLDNNFTYTPPDISVPEILKVGDICDICANIAPKPLLIEKFVDGRNFVVEDERLQEEMDIVKKSYQKSGNIENVTIRKDSDKPDMVSWIIKQLKK